MIKKILKFGGVITNAFVLGQIAFADHEPSGGGTIHQPGTDPQTPTSTTTPPAATTTAPREFRLENPLKSDTIEGVISSVGGFLFGISAALVTIFILIGAYQIMTSGGNPERVTQGRKTILWAIVGFAIVIVASGAVSIIGGILGADTPVDVSQAAYEQCVDRCITAAGSEIAAQSCISSCAVEYPGGSPINEAGDIIVLLQTVAQWMFGILMALGIVFVLYSAFLYLTSGGDSEKVTTARKALTYAIIAMVIGVLAGGVAALVRSIFESAAG